MKYKDILFDALKTVLAFLVLLFFIHIGVPVVAECYISAADLEKQEKITCTVLATDFYIEDVGFGSRTNYDIAVSYNNEVYVIDDRECFYLYQTRIGQEVSALLVTCEWGTEELSSKIMFPEMLSEWEVNPFLNKSHEKERGKQNVE